MLLTVIPPVIFWDFPVDWFIAVNRIIAGITLGIMGLLVVNRSVAEAAVGDESCSFDETRAAGDAVRQICEKDYPLRGVMCTTEAATWWPAAVVRGARPISTGNSVPSFRRPIKARALPILRGLGSAKKERRCSR